MHRYALFVFCLIAATSTLLRAQPASHRCATPEFRQFDFWLGDWEVRDKAGVLEGTNVVTLEHDGCVLIERWSSTDQTGISLNMYDFRTNKWYQSWYDSLGNMLTISGGLKSGTMWLEGERLTPEGRMARERTRWTPLKDGRLHQVWDFSLDNGKTWNLRFEGFYLKRS